MNTTQKKIELSALEFARLQNRYAYDNKINNYNNTLSHEDYKEWYNAVIKFVNWDKEWA